MSTKQNKYLLTQSLDCEQIVGKYNIVNKKNITNYCLNLSMEKYIRWDGAIYIVYELFFSTQPEGRCFGRI